MTTATATMGVPVSEAQSGRSLEELVDRLVDALFAGMRPPQPVNAARALHDARRLRQAGDLDGALTALAQADMTGAQPAQARWAHAEWRDLVRRRFGTQDVLLYSQGTGRAAALLPLDGGLLEAAAVLGMEWRPGETVSRRSLRGLRPLAAGGAR